MWSTVCDLIELNPSRKERRMKIITLILSERTEEAFNYLEDKYNVSTNEILKMAISEYYSDDLSEYEKIKERRA